MNTMFTFRALHTWLLVLAVFELTYPVRSTQHNKTCYPVGNREVCFFLPAADFEWVQRVRAWGTCRSSNGTLPIIHDEGIQRVFERYMTSLKLENLHDMWMAGREVRKSDWSWSNGVPFTPWAQHADNLYQVQGVLDKKLAYKKDSLGNRNNYVCQFFGAGCQLNGSISLKNGCLVLNNEALNFYDSRNKCVERGGDLAVIGDSDELNQFQEVFARIQRASKLWIGLRRQWWIWGGKEEDEVKYSNWKLDNGFQPDSECMVVEMEDYRWKQENCSFYKRFVCQTGPTNVEFPPAPKSDGQPRLSFVVVLIAGISIAVITILLVVIIVVVVVKKRQPRPKQTIIETAPRQTSYQNLERRVNEQSNMTSNQQYTALQPPMRKPLPPPKDPPLQSQQMELNPDYLYDEIADIRIPSYLEVTH